MLCLNHGDKKHILAEREHDKHSQNLFVHQLKKKTAFSKACCKLVMVMVSGWYDVMRHRQSDAHLCAVTKRMQHVLIDRHMHQQQKRVDSTQQVTAAEFMCCKFMPL